VGAFPVCPDIEGAAPTGLSRNNFPVSVNYKVKLKVFYPNGGRSPPYTIPSDDTVLGFTCPLALYALMAWKEEMDSTVLRILPLVVFQP